jgi:hypothetical protein
MSRYGFVLPGEVVNMTCPDRRFMLLSGSDLAGPVADRAPGWGGHADLLLVLGTPIAWWLARSSLALERRPVGAVVALPLVLPPSVLGFYLLLAMGPDGPLGQLTQALGPAVYCPSPSRGW